MLKMKILSITEYKGEPINCSSSEHIMRIIMRYSVHCPSAPFENSSFVSLDDCWGLCLDLSEEYGYAEVRLGDCLMGSYTNGQ